DLVTSGLAPLGLISTSQSRLGEDVMLTQALAFDVQVFDPHAPVYALGANGRPLVASDLQGMGLRGTADMDAVMVNPGDAGWAIGVGVGGTPVSTGAYVDLGYVFRHQRFRQFVLNESSGFPLPSDPNHPILRSSFAGRMHARTGFPEQPGDGYSSDFEATIYRNWCTW